MPQTGASPRDPGELAFDLSGSLPARRVPAWLAPLGSLLATAVLLGAMCAVPPRQPLSISGMLWSALAYVLIAWGGSAAGAMLLIGLLPPSGRSDPGALIARTAAASVWLAPLAVFLLLHSSFAACAAALLAASVTLLIRGLGEPTPPPLPQAAGGLFQIEEAPPFLRQMLPALCAAACIQAGVAAALAPRPTAAALCFAAAAVVVTWAGSAWRDHPAPPPSRRRMLAAGLCAVVLAGAGLARFVALPSGGHGGHAPQGAIEKVIAWVEHLFRPASGSPAMARAATPKLAPPPEDAAALGPGDFPGVILWPKVQPHTMLVAPLPAYGAGLLGMSRQHPLSIPFDGQYWFYKAPSTRPPRSSPVTRGTPDALSFRSVDHRPLKMEAYENFGTLVDLACCSQIRIVVRNADEFPGTVSLELILINTQHGGQQSLGTADVNSTPHWRNGAPPGPTEEVLAYTIPTASAVRQFDLAKVVFQRHPVRWDRSARVAIERFLLVPRSE